MGLAYSFRGLFRCHNGKVLWHAGRQVLEKELRGLHLDLQSAEGETVLVIAWVYMMKPRSSLPQWHTSSNAYSNKATLPNNATPYGPSIKTHDSMGIIPMQTTIPIMYLVIILVTSEYNMNWGTLKDSEEFSCCLSQKRACFPTSHHLDTWLQQF